MDRRRRALVSVALVAAAAALGASVFGGGPVDRPMPPGADLAAQLDALRGANDLVRATRADVGRDPALYPTAYGRLEAALAAGRQAGGAAGLPEVEAARLAELARSDVLDTPAWRGHYVCLALAGSGTDGSRGAATVLGQAGLRERAEREALGYLTAPDDEDDALTSLATRAAFLQTLTCLGRDGEVPRTLLATLAADTARAEQAVPALYAVEALRAVGVRAHATRAVRGADARPGAGCTGLDPIQRAALTLLRQRLTRATHDCLVPVLSDSDPQTRWLVRRALMVGGDGTGPVAGSLPEPVGHVRPDGLVTKTPAQLGTLTATYDAARALTAGAQQEHTPYWLKRRLTRMGADAGLEPSDRLLLAMTCHRLALTCGPQAAKGVAEAARLKVPTRLTPENERRWYGVMAARAEFGLGCGRTTVDSPDGEGGAELSPRALRIAVVLADAGCAAHAARLTEGTDLTAQARRALRAGDLVTASDAVQAALASEQSIPQQLWDDLPGLLRRYSDTRFPDLYAASPGGTASADATRAAYYLLA
ncbi:hypothetical protein [Streptomyces bottropensis]|uniref:Uncharacterized protein n=1 Tax=Streptomyces bottropensis ATCC 25435 TaxID=1054862 RepID=M3EIY4_9ACTN|nr:hypothetical protein [Streptomyces bottropensis]EMF56286.1 hypothetical protein SBD_2318 [Streptomyces bottropensis ATCC 25435]MZD16788.1 hypothetical protein [Streptomyces sp. SID5476]